MKKIFIIKAGSTFPETAARHGDFDEMTKRGLSSKDVEVLTIDACKGEELPSPEKCLGVVITGAHCMVTDNLPWSLAIEAWIPSLIQTEVPLLGVCYGHQLLGRAMGGRVDFHPNGKEVGTVEVRKATPYNADPLFDNVPDQFPVHATHSQSVLTLPPEAALLAENDFEPHHAFRIGRRAWGVQFHPEYDSNIMRDYVSKQEDSLTKAGQDVTRLLHEVRETPVANGLLSHFYVLATEGGL